jgi:preprotein translocase subunit SecG
MGASFGSGTSGSLFGVSGSANFMSRATAIFVIIFFWAQRTYPKKRFLRELFGQN